MPLANILVLFTKGTSEECQQNGETEVQWNPELSLEIALHVGSPFFLSTNSMEAYSCVSNRPLCAQEQASSWHAILCSHDKSTDSVMHLSIVCPPSPLPGNGGK